MVAQGVWRVRVPGASVQSVGPCAPRGESDRLAPMGRSGSKSRKPRRPLAKVPKYEEPNSFPAAGLTGSSGGPYGSRYGHGADHHGRKPPGRFGRFVLRTLAMGQKP